MKINLEGDEIIEKFVEKMMSDKGASGDEEKARLIELLNEKIDEAIVMALPRENFLRLKEAVDADELTEEKLNQIIYSSKVKFEEPVSRAMKSFRDEYLKEEK